MEVGGYTMHLYCDVEMQAVMDDSPEAATKHTMGEFPHQFAGHDRADCRKQARQKGWVFKQDRTVICPKCSRKGIST